MCLDCLASYTRRILTIFTSSRVSGWTKMLGKWSAYKCIRRFETHLSSPRFMQRYENTAAKDSDGTQISYDPNSLTEVQLVQKV